MRGHSSRYCVGVTKSLGEGIRKPNGNRKQKATVGLPLLHDKPTSLLWRGTAIAIAVAVPIICVAISIYWRDASGILITIIVLDDPNIRRYGTRVSVALSCGVRITVVRVGAIGGAAHRNCGDKRTH